MDKSTTNVRTGHVAFYYTVKHYETLKGKRRGIAPHFSIIDSSQRLAWSDLF